METQKNCPKCNVILEEGAEICSDCGNKIEAISSTYETSFCPKCGAKTTTEFVFCSDCRKSLSEEQKENGQSKKTVENKSSFSDKLKPMIKSKKFVVGYLIAIIAILVVVIATLLINNVGLHQIQSNLMYIKDNEIYYTFMSPVEPFELTSRLIDSDNSRRATDYTYQNSIIFSENGKYVYFPDRINDQGLATYFYKELSDNDKNMKAKAARIDTEVDRSSVKLSKDGTKLFYLKGTDRRLFVFDININKSERIDSGVLQFHINESENYIINSKDDDTIREFDLMSKESVRIDSDSEIQGVIGDATKVYYIKDDSLFLKERGQDRVRITTDITQVISLIDSQNIYYSKTEEVSFKAKDFVDDDMLMQDQNIKNPGTEPNSDNYKKQQWVDTDWGGYWDEVTDWDAYNMDWEPWRDARYAYQVKEERDQIRKELETYEIIIDSVDLYHFDGTKETKIAEGIISIIAKSEKKPAIVYTKYKKTDVGRIKISELNWGIREVELLVRNSQTSSADLYAAYTNLENEISVERAGAFSFNNSGTVLYYLDDYSSDKNYGVLTQITFDTGNISKPTVVDGDVSSYRFGNNSDNIIYFKDVKDGIGDAYQDGEVIATDVLLSSIYSYPNSSAIAYFIDYNEKKQNASLYLLKDGTTIKIADEVYSFVAENNYHIAYIVDYRTDRQRGDAYLYDGSSEQIRIDTDVSAWIWKYQYTDRSAIISYNDTTLVGVGNISDSIIGIWYGDVENQVATFDFKADGTMLITGDYHVMEYKYVLDGNKVSFSNEDDSMEGIYSISGDTLYLFIQDHSDNIILTRDNPLIAAFENATVISLNSPINTSTTISNPKMYYAFTPLSSGLYTFESSNNTDCYPFGWLYDSAYNFLESDWNWNNENFCFTYQLTAGQTYYFVACRHNDQIGAYTLTVKRS